MDPKRTGNFLYFLQKKVALKVLLKLVLYGKLGITEKHNGGVIKWKKD